MDVKIIFLNEVPNLAVMAVTQKIELQEGFRGGLILWFILLSRTRGMVPISVVETIFM